MAWAKVKCMSLSFSITHTHITWISHMYIYTVIICYINRYHWQPKAKHSDKSPQLSSFLSKVLLVDWGDKVSGVAIFIGSSVGSKGLTGGEKSETQKIVKNHPIFSATTTTKPQLKPPFCPSLTSFRTMAGSTGKLAADFSSLKFGPHFFSGKPWSVQAPKRDIYIYIYVR